MIAETAGSPQDVNAEMRNEIMHEQPSEHQARAKFPKLAATYAKRYHAASPRRKDRISSAVLDGGHP